MDEVTNLICMDIDSCVQKIMQLLPQSEASVLAMGSLSAAVHILQSAQPRQTYRPIRPVQRQPEPNPEPDPEVDNLDIANLAMAVKQRLDAQNQNHDAPQSLVNKWAGPLPSLGGKKRPAPRQSPALKEVLPDFICPGCEESVLDHNSETNTPADSKGRRVYVLCGSRRVLCCPP